MFNIVILVLLEKFQFHIERSADSEEEILHENRSLFYTVVTLFTEAELYLANLVSWQVWGRSPWIKYPQVTI